MYSLETMQAMERQARRKEAEESYHDQEIEDWLKVNGRIPGKKVA